MRIIIHKIYKLAGVFTCRLFLLFWNLRDRLIPVKADSILFVAHPDDDTLFFHTYIKERKPYVVLMTTGWSLRRMPGFILNMRKYKVRYRAYPLETNDIREDLIKRYATRAMKLGDFHTCVTHGANGEYGHPMHARLYKVIKELSVENLITTVSEERIEDFPLQADLIEEKISIFRKYYKSELFVLEQYVKWIENERLEKDNEQQ